MEEILARIRKRKQRQKKSGSGKGWKDKRCEEAKGHHLRKYRSLSLLICDADDQDRITRISETMLKDEQSRLAAPFLASYPPVG